VSEAALSRMNLDVYIYSKLSYMPVTNKIHFIQTSCYLLQRYLEAQIVTVIVPWVGEHWSEPSIRLSLLSVTVVLNVLHMSCIIIE
jgi:hypothetical protein